MCVSELNFFFPLSCGVEQKKNRWESGGRPNGRRCVSFTRPAGLVVCRRESLRRRRRRSASIDDIEQFVSIAAGDGAHRHLIRFGGVGQDGSADVQRRRRTQVPVQDVPTGRPNPNYIDIIHSLFSFFFSFRSHFFWLALFRLSPFGFQHSLHVPPNLKKQREKKNSSFSSSINTRTTSPVVRRNKTTTRLIHSAYQQKVFLLSQWEAER